jgi:glycosyltransferase involved in cell wall biosynthesis
VLTRGRYKDFIESTLAEKPIPNLRFVYLDLPDWFLKRTKGSDFFLLMYYLWQLAAYFRARRVCRENEIDVIHHVSFSKYWAPCFVSLLPVPFIWGPVGGGESTPPGFNRYYSLRGRFYEFVRSFIRFLEEYDPFVRMTARRSAVSLATTEESARRMRKLGATDVQVYPAIGMTDDDLAELDGVENDLSAGARFVSLGRLLHWKGFDLGIEAFARANIPNSEFWLIGDGPERERLEQLAERCGVKDRVIFWGRLSRSATLEKLGKCYALVHPSFHESGGLVCLEAMAARRPVICLDHGGPAVQVNDEAGFKVKPGDREQVIKDMAKAMVSLSDNQDLWASMGAAGRQRVENYYSWDVKVGVYSRLYEQAVRETPKLSELAVS